MDGVNPKSAGFEDSTEESSEQGCFGLLRTFDMY